MKSGKRYGLWDFTEIWVIPASQVSGCQKSWVITGYGLSERWVMTESTVYQSEGGISGMFLFFYLSDFTLNLIYFFLGLCVAQVRLIFDLLPQFGSFPHPLAYVKWFTQLGASDPNTRLHSITCCTRQAQRNAKIVSVDRIVRGCHLMAWCGQNILSSWTTDNVLEQSSIQYLVNPYINVDTFTLLKST